MKKTFVMMLKVEKASQVAWQLFEFEDNLNNMLYLGVVKWDWIDCNENIKIIWERDGYHAYESDIKNKAIERIRDRLSGKAPHPFVEEDGKMYHEFLDSVKEENVDE